MANLSINIDTLKELIQGDNPKENLMEYIKILIEREEEVVESDALPKSEVIFLQGLGFNDFYGSSSQIFYKAVDFLYGKVGYVLDDDTKGASSFIINRNTKNFNEGDLNTKTQKLLDASDYDSILEMIHDVIKYNKTLGQYAKDISTLSRLRKALSGLVNKVSRSSFNKFHEFYKAYKKKGGYDLCKEIYKQKIKTEEDHKELMLGMNRYMIDNETQYLKKPERFLQDGDRKSYIGRDDDEFYAHKSIEKLNIRIYEDYLKQQGKTINDPGYLNKRKRVLQAIWKRVEDLGGDTSDPSTWDDLLRNTYRS